jgi:hypothetical protein
MASSYTNSGRENWYGLQQRRARKDRIGRAYLHGMLHGMNLGDDRTVGQRTGWADGAWTEIEPVDSGLGEGAGGRGAARRREPGGGGQGAAEQRDGSGSIREGGGCGAVGCS